MWGERRLMRLPCSLFQVVLKKRAVNRPREVRPQCHALNVRPYLPALTYLPYTSAGHRFWWRAVRTIGTVATLCDSRLTSSAIVPWRLSSR